MEERGGIQNTAVNKLIVITVTVNNSINLIEQNTKDRIKQDFSITFIVKKF